MRLADIEGKIRERGLTPRGAFHVHDDDGVPPLGDGRPARTLLLVGNVGSGMWRAFTAGLATTGSDLLDRWVGGIIDALAVEFGADSLSPHEGPPYLPFQRWAQRADSVAPSPLGILIHPEYGLWHGYRGAMAFGELLDVPPLDRRPTPCDSCTDKPCLAACPVGAFDSQDYDVAACTDHIASAEGEACLGEGCAARRACPVGRGYQYEPAQARFHMTAFLRARRRAYREETTP